MTEAVQMVEIGGDTVKINSVENNIFVAAKNTSTFIANARKALYRYIKKQTETGTGEPLFYYEGTLVTVSNSDREGNYVIVPVTDGKLDDILCYGNTWIDETSVCDGENTQKKKKTPKNTQLKTTSLKAVISAGPERLPPVPILKGILFGGAAIGITRDDDGNTAWSLRMEKGYDPVTKFYLTDSCCLDPIPDEIDDKLICGFKTFCWEIFKEFHFDDNELGEESVSFQNAVLAAACCALRQVWNDEAMPVFAVPKGGERSGGSLLQGIVGLLGTGEPPLLAEFQKKEDKNVTAYESTLLQGVKCHIIDNVFPGYNWYDPLLSYLSGSGKFPVRIFHTQNQRMCDRNTVFMANGKSLRLDADVTGRVIVSRIIPKKSWQEIASTFTRSEDKLREIAKAKHPEFLRWLVILHKYWVQKGRPAATGIEGNFSAYPTLLREVVPMFQAAGFTQVLQNLKDIQTEENEADAEIIAVIEAIRKEGVDGKEITVGAFDNPKTTKFTAKELVTKLIDQAYAERTHPDNCEDRLLLDAMSEETLEKLKLGKLRSSNFGQTVLNPIAQRGRIYGYQYVLKRAPKKDSVTRERFYWIENAVQQQTLAP